MHILYGITKSNWGGAQRYVYDLALSAKEAGHDVSVLCGGNGPLVTKLKEAHVSVISLPSLSRDITLLADIQSFFGVLAILRREHPDVFHINSSKMGGLGALAGRLARVERIIFTAHGWAFNESRNWLQKIIIKQLVWLTILLSHKTICVSEKTRRDVVHWPLIGKRLVVVRNGLNDFTLESPTPRETLTIGTIAELHKVKGLDILLAAWKDFTKNHRAKLIIVGDGEERENLLKLSRVLGVNSSVEFRGFVDNAKTHLSEFDIFVLSSRSEAMPYAPLEAGLASLPVIATLVGGIPEIIKDSETGLLVRPEDPVALAQALANLAKDKTLRKVLGTNLNAFVRANFSKDKMVIETFKLYQ